ncbi:hypothetical protein ACIQWR_15170 [Streptomyces sp. NPDC098789]|uniref:DUF7848 domain-containing protein n=1 Tax=Streptomyces sp. NPDC098789 TaxID=3366098 RepID=UPI0038032F04
MKQRFTFAAHRIIRDPGTAPVVAAECVTDGCGWASGPDQDVAAVDRLCMKHTGRNPTHKWFAREVTDIARVDRVTE